MHGKIQYHAVSVRAKTAEEAKEKFDQLGHERFDDMEDYELDVQYKGSQNVNGFQRTVARTRAPLTTQLMMMMMRSRAKQVCRSCEEGA